MTDTPSPLGEPTLTEVLLAALKGAAKAHGAYEAKELGGVYDDNWPQWYAEHMTHALGEAGYRLSRIDPRSEPGKT
ncbi:MAG: hypothetical protein JWQ89_3240 [Devosia sp.]|uniref:hypothetical protein n=1 Tax=Devosia sp. TaxID=1871048 RepID=UPI002A6F4279|nr:hypothetical protein [Devosia sp.]